MTALLREREVPYVVVTPTAAGEIDEELYHRLVRGQRTPLEELLGLTGQPGDTQVAAASSLQALIAQGTSPQNDAEFAPRVITATVATNPEEAARSLSIQRTRVLLIGIAGLVVAAAIVFLVLYFTQGQTDPSAAPDKGMVLNFMGALQALKGKFSQQPLSADEEETFQGNLSGPVLNRREFLKRVGGGSFALLLSSFPGLAKWLGAGELAAEPLTPQERSPLAQFLPHEVLENELKLAQAFINGQKVTSEYRYLGGYDLTGLYRTYDGDSARDAEARTDAQYIAYDGRVWPYSGAGLAVEALLAMAEVEGNSATAAALKADAARAADASVRLAKENARRGHKGLTFFSYGAQYTDPREISGLTGWMVIGVLREALVSQSPSHFAWAVNAVREYFFQQQVYGPQFSGDERYGHIRAGLDRGKQMENVVGEHTADMVEIYKLMGQLMTSLPQADVEKALGNQSAVTAFRKELIARHEAGVKALQGLWVEGSPAGARVEDAWAQMPHFVTGRKAPVSGSKKAPLVVSTQTGDYSVAGDNETWFGSQVLPYDEAKAAGAFRYFKARFVRVRQVQGKDGTIKNLKGANFFTWDFEDPYVEGMSMEDRLTFEKMIQPEVTAQGMKLCINILRFSNDEALRAEAFVSLVDLYANMVALHKHWGGEGLPYATERVLNYFNTMEGMDGTTWFAGVTAMLMGASPEGFLGSQPPADFVVDGELPAQARANWMQVNLSGAQIAQLKATMQALETQTGLKEEAKEKAPVEKPVPKETPKEKGQPGRPQQTVPQLPIKSGVTIEGGVSSGAIVGLNIANAPPDAVVMVVKVTDTGYLQPAADGAFSFPVNAGTIHTFRPDLLPGTTLVLVVKKSAVDQILSSTGADKIVGPTEDGIKARLGDALIAVKALGAASQSKREAPKVQPKSETPQASTNVGMKTLKADKNGVVYLTVDGPQEKLNDMRVLVFAKSDALYLQAPVGVSLAPADSNTRATWFFDNLKSGKTHALDTQHKRFVDRWNEIWVVLVDKEKVKAIAEQLYGGDKNMISPSALQDKSLIIELKTIRKGASGEFSAIQSTHLYGALQQLGIPVEVIPSLLSLPQEDLVNGRFGNLLRDVPHDPAQVQYVLRRNFLTHEAQDVLHFMNEGQLMDRLVVDVTGQFAGERRQQMEAILSRWYGLDFAASEDRDQLFAEALLLGVIDHEFTGANASFFSDNPPQIVGHRGERTREEAGLSVFDGVGSFVRNLLAQQPIDAAGADAIAASTGHRPANLLELVQARSHDGSREMINDTQQATYADVAAYADYLRRQAGEQYRKEFGDTISLMELAKNAKEQQGKKTDEEVAEELKSQIERRGWGYLLAKADVVKMLEMVVGVSIVVVLLAAFNGDQPVDQSMILGSIFSRSNEDAKTEREGESAEDDKTSRTSITRRVFLGFLGATGVAVAAGGVLWGLFATDRTFKGWPWPRNTRSGKALTSGPFDKTDISEP